MDRQDQLPNLSSSSAQPPVRTSSLIAGPHSSAHDRDGGLGTMFPQSTPARADEWNSVPFGNEDPGIQPAWDFASPSNSQGTGAMGGQTLLDFLRQSNIDHHHAPPVYPQQSGEMQPRPDLPLPHSSRDWPLQESEPSSAASRYSERKRRLTTGASPERRHGSTSRPGHAGSSRSNPIVLDTSPSRTTPQSPPAVHPTRSSYSRRTRRDSDLVLPPWQPDSDVTNCPVCGSAFTFFHRKHHCRKCGRVVCATCSPHRITIPRQFIVHPPDDPPSSAGIHDLTAGEDDEHRNDPSSSSRNPALGGGEEVRVCRPCVPDPNYNPPPPYYNLPTAGPFNSHASQGYTHGPSLHRSSRSYGDGPINLGARSANADPSANRPSNRLERWPDFGDATQMQFGQNSLPGNMGPPVHPSRFGDPRGLNSAIHNHTFGPPISRPRQQGNWPLTDNEVARPMNPAQRPPEPTRRRQIAEEDECPICGSELPPKGFNNDDSARVEHINNCILVHSSSPAPAPANNAMQTSASLPTQRVRGMSSAATGTDNAAGRPVNNNRISISARGLFPYKATEKDAIDEQGNPAECVICFEEFEAGDGMARLVCLCKFHEHCIREWWGRKGRGSCPTHLLLE